MNKTARSLMVVTGLAAVSLAVIVPASGVAAHKSKTPKVLVVKDPKADVETYNPNGLPQKPNKTDDLVAVTVKRGPKKVIASYKTRAFYKTIDSATIEAYTVYLEASKLFPNYQIEVQASGSAARLAGVTPAAKKIHGLWQSAEIAFSTKKDQKMGAAGTPKPCPGLHVQPDLKNHVWDEIVPESCLPHLKSFKYHASGQIRRTAFPASAAGASIQFYDDYCNASECYE